jgi:hypothetical protein
MSQSSLVCWVEHVVNRHKNTPALLQQLLTPDLIEFVNHYIDQVSGETEAQTIDAKAVRLINQGKEAKIAIESNNLTSVAMAFFWLGVIVEEFNHPNNLELNGLKIAANRERLKTLALARHALKLDTVKAIAQAHAQILWGQHPQVRVGEMSEDVFGRVKSYFNSEKFHNSSGSEILSRSDIIEIYKTLQISTIRKWLKEIAPKEASRRGRPKKN